jgi:hypothetical protein
MSKLAKALSKALGTVNETIQQAVSFLQGKLDSSRATIVFSIREVTGSKRMGVMVVAVETIELMANGGVTAELVIWKGAYETNESFYERCGERGVETDDLIEHRSVKSDETDSK